MHLAAEDKLNQILQLLPTPDGMISNRNHDNSQDLCTNDACLQCKMLGAQVLCSCRQLFSGTDFIKCWKRSSSTSDYTVRPSVQRPLCSNEPLESVVKDLIPG